LADFAISLSPVVEGDSLASAVPRQIANANTLFNVVNTIIFIGFTGWFAKIATRMAPTPPENTSILIEPKYLMDDVIETPSLALGQVRLELSRMGEMIHQMFSDVQPATLNRDKKELEKIFLTDDKVNILQSSTLEYLSKLRKEELTEQESHDHQAMMITTINLQNISSVIRDDISEILFYFIKKNYRPSDTTREIFLDFYHDICLTLEETAKAIGTNDQVIAEQVINRRTAIKDYEEKILSRKSSHLGKDEEDYLKMAQLELSLMEKMFRIYSLTRRISKNILTSS